MTGQKAVPTARRRNPYPPVTTAQKWGLFAVLVLAALLRIDGLSSYSLWYDEAHSLYYGRFVDLHGSLLDPRNMIEPPMMAVLSKLWYGAIQGATDLSPISAASDFLIRLLPCIFSVLGVYCVYHATRVLSHDNGAALAASFFCAISPFQVHYAQELRIYSIYMTCSLAIVIFLMRALEEDRARWWAGLAATEALLLYMHFAGVWTLLFINIAYVVCFVPNWLHARQRFFKWYTAQAVAFVLALPAILLLLRVWRDAAKIEAGWYHFALSWKIPFIAFKTFFAGYGPTVWAYWGLFLLAGLLALLGLWYMRKRPAALLLIVLLAAGPLALNLYLWRHQDIVFYHHRMFIFSGAMAYVLAGAGLNALGGYRRVGIAVAVLFALTIPGLRDHYAERIHPIEVHRPGIYTHSDYRAAASYIEAQWQEGDALTAASHYLTPSLRHYLQREPLRLGTEPWERTVMMQVFGQDALLYRQHVMPRQVSVALRGYDRVWFVESTGLTFEYKPHTEPVRAWLEEHYDALDDQTFYGLRVTLYGREESGTAGKGGT